MYQKASRLRREVCPLILPPDRRPLSELLPELLYMENAGAMMPIDMSLTPYMREPADCLKSRRYSQVIFAGPARTGKSAALVEGFLMDSAAKTRADTLLVHISKPRAAEFSKRNLRRSMEASPVVREALSPRKHDNGIHLIKFKAGNFLNIGWPSKNVFASATYQRVVITDYDRIPLNIDNEGSALVLAGKRTQTQGSSGMVAAEGSPGFMVTDPTRIPVGHESPPTLGILAEYNEGDRRQFYWQCLAGCGEFFIPDFDLLQYDRHEPDPLKASKGVLLACPHCGCTYSEGQRIGDSFFKREANLRGVWVPDGCRVDQNGVMTGERRDTTIASFWLKSLPAAFQSWESLVARYVAARNLFEETGVFESLKAVTNVDLGLPFTPPRAEERDTSTLMARRVDMGRRIVPSWCRFLLAQVDVQGGKNRRFEVMVTGVGPNLEMAIVDRFSIEKSARVDPGDPDKFVRVKPGVYPEDWDLLTEKVINRAYEVDGLPGKSLRIYRTACDSAGEDGVTAQAYSYYRRLKVVGLHKRFVLVKGADRPGAPLVEERRPDNTARKDRKSGASSDVPVLFINSNRMKDVASAMLNREHPGPRYLHLPSWLPESFFAELMAEERSAEGTWSKISKSSSNESFDLLVYAWALVHMLKAERIQDWDSPPSWAEVIELNPEVVDSGEDISAIPARRRRRARS